ncbi:phosphoglycerate dehydrogenase [Actinomadura sp. KC345]|nr:phosphoglycerate dehydrogenase [Actinomadura sp. KC345]
MAVDVAVVEDVWGAPFETLAARRSVLRDPDVWEAPDRLLAAAGAARALVVRNRTRVTRELLGSAPGLRVVARAGAGLDNVDLEAAEELGVTVVAALGANAVSVAEHSLGLAFAVARRLVELDREVRGGGWRRVPGRELAGGTWGMLSAGATARATARLARGIGMRVVACDPHVPADHPEVRELGIGMLPLERVVDEADVLSVHLPATERTTGLVDASLLARCKPGAILISVGRGEVVDESALADALESGRLAGAGLDVRADEPPVPGRLEGLSNVVLTPHVAGITAQSQTRIAQILCDDIDAVLDGRAPSHAVTSPKGRV